MCNKACLDFGALTLKEEDLRGKSVIEVGAMNINGSLRSLVESFGPKEYLGVDINPGPGVDLICAVEELKVFFGADRFDLVICTEVLEHVKDWQRAIHNLKQIVKPEGALLITTRSKGFGYHNFPFDFWRFGILDFKFIFSDFDIQSLKSDTSAPGVFLFAKKPAIFTEQDIKGYKLYSILFNRKIPAIKKEIDGLIFIVSFLKTFCLRVRGSAAAQLLKRNLKKFISPERRHLLRILFMRLAKKTALTEISLEFVNYCNLRCKWCSLDHGQKKYEMSEELLRKFFENLLIDKRFRGLKRINLFNGGEPLLHPDFIRMLKVIREYKLVFLKNKLEFPEISLLTNGTALNARLSRELVELGVLDIVRFSIDGGSKEKFEALRSPASWEAVSGNLKDFIKINQGRIASGIICLIEHGKPMNIDWMSAEFKEICRLVDQLELRYPHDWRGEVEVEGYKKSFKDYCGFLFQSLCLLPNADVVVCCADLNGKVGVVGNLYQQDLYAIYNSSRRRTIQSRFLQGQRKELELCRNCSLNSKSVIIFRNSLIRPLA